MTTKIQHGMLQYGPAFAAKALSGLTVPLGVLTKCPMSSEVFDTDSCYDSTTNYRFTPNVAGYYQVSGAVSGGCTTATGRVTAHISKNSSVLITGSSPPQGSTDEGDATVAGLVYMNGTTDYLELWGSVNGTGTATMLGTIGNYFSAALVRAA